MFKIKTDSLAVCISPQELEIQYAVRTRRSASGYENRVHLGDSDYNGNHFFEPDTTMFRDTQALETFKKALCDWNAVSGISWSVDTTAIERIDRDTVNGTITLDTIYNIGNAIEDTICKVFFSDVGLDSAATATSIIYINICQGTGAPMITEIDFQIRENLNTLPRPVPGGWNFDPDTVPSISQYDFYSVALHELGHGHGLKHAKDSSKIMYYALNEGDIVRNISSGDNLGANDILDTSIDSIGYCSIVKGSCDAILAINTITNIKSQIKLYPNPFLNRINIEIELIKPSDLKVSVYNISGQKEIEIESFKCSAGINNINLTLDDLASGFHILVLQFDSRIIPVKVLKYD